MPTRLCGVSAPVGPRSGSGSKLFSGEDQWFSRSSDFERVYDASGSAASSDAVPRCARPDTRTALVGEQIHAAEAVRHRENRTGGIGLGLSANHGVWIGREQRVQLSFGITCAALTSRNPCLIPRFMLASTAMLVRVPSWRWKPMLAARRVRSRDQARSPGCCAPAVPLPAGRPAAGSGRSGRADRSA